MSRGALRARHPTPKIYNFHLATLNLIEWIYLQILRDFLAYIFLQLIIKFNHTALVFGRSYNSNIVIGSGTSA